MQFVLCEQGTSSTSTSWSSLTTSPASASVRRFTDVRFDFAVPCLGSCSSKHVFCDVGCTVVCNCDSGKNAAHSTSGGSLRVHATLEKHAVRFAGGEKFACYSRKQKYVLRVMGRAVHLMSRRVHFFSMWFTSFLSLSKLLCRLQSHGRHRCSVVALDMQCAERPACVSGKKMWIYF